MCGNAGVKQLFGGYTPGPSVEEKQAALDAPRLAMEAANKNAGDAANAKLAARNKRRSMSVLATVAGDSGSVAAPASGKSVLGA